MSQSLSKVYVHITFSTKHRQNLITESIQKSLFDYIGGTCKGLECNPIRVGGYQNHIHILCLMSKKITQVKLLEEVKKRSSKWIKTQDKNFYNFYWQDGYGIFSVNPSEINVVEAYINNQSTHHKSVSYQDEYRAFLKKYKVDYASPTASLWRPMDERYVWD